jgi:hypothetical protein
MRDPAKLKTSSRDDGLIVQRPVVPERETAISLPAAAGPTTIEALNRFRDEIAAEFERREIEIERRERTLAEQLAALDRDQRAFRFAEQAFQQKCHERDAAQIARDAEFAERLARCEALVTELEDEQAALDTDRRHLDEQKASIREAALAELAAERERVDAERETLFAEKKEFRRRAEQHEKEISSARDELRKSWDIEREALRKQLTAKLASELSADRREFEQQILQWQDRQRDEQALLESERSAAEQAIAKAKGDLERLGREQELEFARRRRELEAEIDHRVRAAEAAFHRQQAEWETARSATEAELRELRTALDEQRAEQEEALAESRAQFERHREERLAAIEAAAIEQRREIAAEQAEASSQISAERERIGRESAALEKARDAFDAEQRQRWERVTGELAKLRQQHDEELLTERLTFEQEQAAARLALDEERAVMENRLQFQKDHLDRTRDELEEARRELERRLQKGRTQAVGLAEQFRLRQAHLARFRRLLDDREAAIERERVALAESRTQSDDEKLHETARRRDDEEARRRDTEAERTALQHLQGELAQKSEQLTARQNRLETLRTELESTHRENLELRVALDETWIKLSQAANPDKAKQQLAATRALVADHFRQKEAEIDRRRSLLTDDAAHAHKQLEHLEARRQELNEWLSAALDTLHRREDELKRWAATLDARETRSQMLSAKWHEDRSSAEAVIRDLLRQISDTVSSPTDDHIEIEEGTVVESPVIAGRLTDVKQTETDPPSRSVPSGPHFSVASRSTANVAKPKAG